MIQHGIQIAVNREQVPYLPMPFLFVEPTDKRWSNYFVLVESEAGRLYLVALFPPRLVPQCDGFIDRWDFDKTIPLTPPAS